jgi:alpha-tubulin suppressor-like RCC1 family protein
MVSAGNGYTCAVTVEGAVYCWGQGNRGQLGDGTLRNRHRPAWVDLPFPARSVEAAQQTTCPVTEASRLFCWGSPYSYSPENPDRADSLYPRPAAVLGEREILSAAVGGGRMCGADRDNSVWCLGVMPAMFGGALLVDTTPDPHVWHSDPDMAQLSLGHYHDCYVDRSGAAWCGGDNSYGQLGIGRLGTGAEFPSTPVAGALRFSHVTTGFYHTCGLAGTTAHCWGFNSEGQLGTGNVDWSFAPVPVVGGLEWSALDAGPAYTCALTPAGVAHCWGDNRWGQLGDGTRTRRLAPVAIGGDLRFRSISVGWDHACALATDGAIYCWGENEFGQLGDGSTSDALSPVRAADRR